MNWLWGGVSKKVEKVVEEKPKEQYKNEAYINKLPKDKEIPFRFFRNKCVSWVKDYLMKDEKHPIYTQPNRLVRFFIGKKYSQKVAFDCWQQWVKWHVEYRPDLIKAVEVEADIKERHSFICGVDKLGHPIINIKVARVDAQKKEEDQFFKFMMWRFEESFALAEKISPDGMVSIIQDRKDFDMKKHMNIKLIKPIISKLTVFCPERLHSIFVVNAGVMFSVVWNLVSRFLDPKTKSKVQNINVEELLNYIDKDQLSKDLGGTLDEPSDEELMADNRFTYKSWINFPSNKQQQQVQEVKEEKEEEQPKEEKEEESEEQPKEEKVEENQVKEEKQEEEQEEQPKEEIVEQEQEKEEMQEQEQLKEEVEKSDEVQEVKEQKTEDNQ